MLTVKPSIALWSNMGLTSSDNFTTQPLVVNWGQVYVRTTSPIGLDSDHLYFVLGDVCGKGVPATLFMAVTKTLLGAAAPAAVSPGAILAQ